MNSIEKALKGLPANVRDMFYVVQTWLSVVLGATSAGVAAWSAATGDAIPVWFVVTLAVLAFLGVVPGQTARAHLSED